VRLQRSGSDAWKAPALNYTKASFPILDKARALRILLGEFALADSEPNIRCAIMKTTTLLIVSLAAVSAGSRENPTQWPHALDLQSATVVGYQP